MNRSRSISLVVLAGAFAFAACSSDATSDAANVAGAGSGGSGAASDAGAGGKPAATAQEAGPSAPAPYNADCSTARWGNVSDECWSCLCGACKPTLDLCNEDCMSVLNCATSQHALVNVAADLSCEVRATVALCLKDPKSQAVANPLLTFDGCLLTGPKNGSPTFRFCDTECKTPYSGDVCARFPAAPPATP